MHINELMQQIPRRAERNDPEILRESFVSVGGVTAALNGADHQVIFGRRGTGKTHALMYKKQIVKESGGISVFVDLRVLGSDSSIYNDENISISQRATRLLIDFIRRYMRAFYKNFLPVRILGTFHRSPQRLASFSKISMKLKYLEVLKKYLRQVQTQTVLWNLGCRYQAMVQM